MIVQLLVTWGFDSVYLKVSIKMFLMLYVGHVTEMMKYWSGIINNAMITKSLFVVYLWCCVCIVNSYAELRPGSPAGSLAQAPDTNSIEPTNNAMLPAATMVFLLMVFLLMVFLLSWFCPGHSARDTEWPGLGFWFQLTYFLAVLAGVSLIFTLSIVPVNS